VISTVPGTAGQGHRGRGAHADEPVAVGVAVRSALCPAEPGRTDLEALVEVLARPLQVVAMIAFSTSTRYFTLPTVTSKANCPSF